MIQQLAKLFLKEWVKGIKINVMIRKSFYTKSTLMNKNDES